MMMDMDEHQKPAIEGDGQPIIDPINFMGVQQYFIFSPQDQQQLNIAGDSLPQRVLVLYSIDNRERPQGMYFLLLRIHSSGLVQPTISSLVTCLAN